MNVTRALSVLLTTVAAATLSLMTAGLSPTAAAAPLYPSPDPDPFYWAPPDLAHHGDGDVLRARLVPATGFPGATAWQLLFRSQNSAGGPIAAMTTVLLPLGGGMNRPLLSYQAFINSLGTQCAPSHTLFNGQLPEATALNLFLSRGWAVAVPDHLGPTSAYGAAQLGGRLTLDGIRAAKRFPSAGLGGSPVGMMGYSGGGMATSWAAALAPKYAPELPIVGAAQGGVPVNLGQLALDVGLRPSPLFGLGFASAMGLEREYPKDMHFSQFLNPIGWSLRGRMANSCVDSIIGAGAGLSLEQIGRPGVLDADDATKNVLHENSLDMFAGVPRTPIYEWHGGNDQVSVPLARQLAGRYCHSGDRVLFDVIPGADHGTAILPGASRAVNYLADRFAGIPAPSNCFGPAPLPPGV